MLSVAVLASCSESEEPVANGGEVQIRLNAGLPTATASSDSRQPITGTETFSATVGGWETADAVDYTVAPAWTSVTSAIAANANQQGITLDPVQFYEPNDADKTYMKAWYPQAVPTDGVVTFANTDGSVDAMLAAQVMGSRKDAGTKTLEFSHLTTQLIFVVKGDVSLNDGTTVNMIRVNGAELPTGINLTTDTGVFTAATDGGLTVPGINGVVIPKDGDPVTVGNPVMIRPITQNTLTLDVTTSGNAYEDIVVTVDGDSEFQAGKAYTITLTFMQEQVRLNATVSEWQTGTGSATII